MAKQKTYSQEYVDNHECAWSTDNSRFKNLIGNEYGKLKVIKMHYRESPHTFWLLKCECGTHISLSTNNIATGRESCSVCAFSKMSKNCTVSLEKSLAEVKEKHPTLEYKSHKKLGVKYKWLWYCTECETPFYASCANLKSSNGHVCRCNPIKFCKWTQQLRDSQIKDLCATRNLKFLGWKDEYKSVTSRFFVKCPVHQHYEVNVNNFTNTSMDYGCPSCSLIKPTRPKHNVEEMEILSSIVHGEGMYSYQNFVYTGSRDSSYIHCNTCDSEFKNSYDNHINKGQGCRCKAGYGYNTGMGGKFYLHKLDDFAVKYGITNYDPYERMRLQSKSGNYDHEMLYVFESDNGQLILDCETYIKRNVQKNFITKDKLGQGFSETMCISNLDITLQYLKSKLGLPTIQVDK